MQDLKQQEFPIFDLFSSQAALVTAGSIDNFNGCTIGWGSMGNIWGRDGHTLPIVTVYVHPARYTCDFLKANSTFTVSFFPKEYRKALGYMGSHSGRDGDKVSAAGLTPLAVGDSVAYREANLVFLCRKLYQHEFEQEGLYPEICEYYKSNPQSFPRDASGDWHAHYMFVGEILQQIDKR